MLTFKIWAPVNGYLPCSHLYFTASAIQKRLCVISTTFSLIVKLYVKVTDDFLWSWGLQDVPVSWPCYVPPLPWTRSVGWDPPFPLPGPLLSCFSLPPRQSPQPPTSTHQPHIPNLSCAPVHLGGRLSTLGESQLQAHGGLSERGWFPEQTGHTEIREDWVLCPHPDRLWRASPPMIYEVTTEGKWLWSYPPTASTRKDTVRKQWGHQRPPLCLLSS